jgi:hypothetical protein
LLKKFVRLKIIYLEQEVDKDWADEKGRIEEFDEDISEDEDAEKAPEGRQESVSEYIIRWQRNWFTREKMKGNRPEKPPYNEYKVPQVVLLGEEGFKNLNWWYRRNPDGTPIDPNWSVLFPILHCHFFCREERAM